MMIRTVFLLALLSFCSAIYADKGKDVLRDVVAKTFESSMAGVPIEQLLEAGEWAEDKASFLVHIPKGIDSLLYIFIKQDNETYLPVNLNYLVNSGYNGKLGRKRNYYDRYEQDATLSIGWREYVVGVSITTRAWKDGQRYTVKKKPVLIKKEGEIFNP